MPELPEVELTRRHLEQAMTGRVITSARVSHARTARRNSSPDEIEAALMGRRVASVERRGKFLLFPLDDGRLMVAHLGMSGRFSLDRNGENQPAHTHFVADLDDGTQVRFIDPRTFGFVAVFDEGEQAGTGMERLGPDALSDPLTPAGLAARLAHRRAPIKALLLDQVALAGLGNIYADEALHLARIHPLTPGGELSEARLAELLEAISQVLEAAIETGGTTLDDLAYLLPDGTAGENLERLAVYGRDGQPCLACGTVIEKVTVRSRSTHYCPGCQK